MPRTNETKWTPGPWSVGTRFIEGENEVFDAEGFSVADPSIFPSAIDAAHAALAKARGEVKP